MMAASHNSDKTKGAAPDQENAPSVTNTSILPNYPTPCNVDFVVEVLPCPLRAPPDFVQLNVSWRSETPLPADAGAQIVAVLKESARRAQIASAMPREAHLMWGGK